MGTLTRNGLKYHETILSRILFCYLGPEIKRGLALKILQKQIKIPLWPFSD